MLDQSWWFLIKVSWLLILLGLLTLVIGIPLAGLIQTETRAEFHAEKAASRVVLVGVISLMIEVLGMTVEHVLRSACGG